MNIFFMKSFVLLIGITIWALLPVRAQLITIESQQYAIVLSVDSLHHLNMIYHGDRMQEKDYAMIGNSYRFIKSNTVFSNNAYPSAGTWSLVDPAIQITHTDGNLSTDLAYVDYEKKENANMSEIVIHLKDPVYAVSVFLHYIVWKKENVFKQWVVVRNQESGSIFLDKCSSASLYFANQHMYLTSFYGGYEKEMQPSEELLAWGTHKSIESILGTRAMLLNSPTFILSFGQPAQEDRGEVMLGELAWTGNYKLSFEEDENNALRFTAGIHPYLSRYKLSSQDSFETPSLIYTFSSKGTGDASRQMQSWVRNNALVDGNGERLTLLNNWETTYFNFNQAKLFDLIDDTKKLGVDLFLLDDGWFGGTAYPRIDDYRGLGDWQPALNRLPHGLDTIINRAKKEKIKFGIWIEPEMVNPKSELYAHHLDWVIRQPDRPETYFRHQLVLDLSNPAVQDFVFSIVDTLLTQHPYIAFIKWDCNAYITNPYSAYLQKQGSDAQGKLYIDYVKGLYNVLDRVRTKYPYVSMMLCSGGGARADYKILSYFNEFWVSDNTDPLERIFIQWGDSYFYPAIAMDCHVTNWSKAPIKFKVDVASMGKLGFDLNVHTLSPNDLLFCQQAVQHYNLFKDIVWHGTQYRLVDPYSHDYAAISYVSKDQKEGVLFSYLITNRFFKHVVDPIHIKGLDSNQLYQIKEINLYPNTTSPIDSTILYSGRFLMNVGINPYIDEKRRSVVILIKAVGGRYHDKNVQLDFTK